MSKHLQVAGLTGIDETPRYFHHYITFSPLVDSLRANLQKDILFIGKGM